MGQKADIFSLSRLIKLHAQMMYAYYLIYNIYKNYVIE